jgi:hypothetical protein
MEKQRHLLNIIEEVYKCISGYKDTERDWDKYLTLFMPGAKLNIIYDNGNSKAVESKSVVEYIDYFLSIIGNNAFFERQISYRIEYVDSFAVVSSDYEARFSPIGPVVYSGTNCFQLYFNGKNWSIISILWERKVKAIEVAGSNKTKDQLMIENSKFPVL